MPTYFAEIDASGVVLRVIVADAQFVARLGGTTWVETFMDGSRRKNFAGPGHRFDTSRDAFIAPRPAADYELDAATCRWEPNAKERARLGAKGAKGPR